LLPGHAVALFQISPATKGFLTGGGEHDGAKALRVEDETVPQVLELLPHQGVEGVGDLGSVQAHLQNKGRDFLGQNGLVAWDIGFCGRKNKIGHHL